VQIHFEASIAQKFKPDIINQQAKNVPE